MSTIPRFIALVAFTAILGCNRGEEDTGPFGSSQKSELLVPFAGKWTCDFEKTLEARKAAGSSAAEIENLRKFYDENSQFGNIHPDITITDNVAVSDDPLSSEYRFFHMHKHDGKVCGKAWHHEDRHDPGDMSKCFVRLQLQDELLYMEVRMKDGLPDLTDPDLETPNQVEGGSAGDCESNNPQGPDWLEWSTYVFQRKT